MCPSTSDSAVNLLLDEILQEDGYHTDDSGFEDASVLTESVRTSVYAYKYEHGRRYHAYKEGAYFMPNDEPEQDRMDMQHQAFVLASRNNLFLAPIKSPKKVLDIGTGTGIWAIEFADQLPEAEIIGTDLSPIQPRYVPPNLKFEIDDAEDNWTFPENHFDYIHERLLMCGSIKDTQKFFDQSFQHLKPGGYFEIQEIRTEIRSDHYTFPEDSPMKQWCQELTKGILLMDRTLDLDWNRLAERMRKSGFVDVQILELKVPIGKWPADPQLKEAGMFQLVSLLEGMESIGLVIFTRLLGWQKIEMDVLLAKARQELCLKKGCMYWPGATSAIIYGRKPDTTN